MALAVQVRLNRVNLSNLLYTAANQLTALDLLRKLLVKLHISAQVCIPLLATQFVVVGLPLGLVAKSTRWFDVVAGWPLGLVANNVR
jgi:hypothetical protein